MTHEREISIETANGEIIEPDATYDPLKKYGELVIICEIEMVEDTYIIAGYAGPEYHEEEISTGFYPEFSRIKEIQVMGGDVFLFTGDSMEEIEQECRRQLA